MFLLEVLILRLTFLLGCVRAAVLLVCLCDDAGCDRVNELRLGVERCEVVAALELDGLCDDDGRDRIDELRLGTERLDELECLILPRPAPPRLAPPRDLPRAHT